MRNEYEANEALAQQASEQPVPMTALEAERARWAAVLAPKK